MMHATALQSLGPIHALVLLVAFVEGVEASRGAQEADPVALEAANAYDPLAPRHAGDAVVLDLEVVDEARGRTLPLRVYLPPMRAAGAPGERATPTRNGGGVRATAGATKGPGPAAVVLFSHGLGGSCRNNPYLGEHWAARGYAVVFVQHPGSDESVWKDAPLRERRAELAAAASTEQFLARMGDVPAVLDALEGWNGEAGHALFGRLGLQRVGMSGHSFGAVTTQSVSGQAAGRLGARFTDERIDAALAMSPSSPRRGDPQTAFATVAVPWMLMTGTHDLASIGDQTPQSRREVYPHLPASIDRYELVLDGAEHSAFGDRALAGDSQSRNPNHHRVILALSTAFWDAHLLGEQPAREWLHGAGPRGVLEDADLWQCSAGE